MTKSKSNARFEAKKSRLNSFFRQADLLPKSVNLLFALIALGLIALSFIRPWYALPQLNPEKLSFYTQDSSLTPTFKLALVIFWLLMVLPLLFTLLKRSQSYAPGLLILRATSFALLALLTFPTFLILIDSESAGDGAWLQQQHDTMTWLGGDIYRAHSERSIESGTGVNAQDPPERLAVFRPPTGSLGISRLNDWIWWLGYGPSWTQFVGKGWFFGTIGYGLLTICIFGYFWRKHIPTARYYLRKIIIQNVLCYGLFFALVFALYAFTRHQLRTAESFTAEGDYHEASHSLYVATTLIPSLSNDSGIIRQIGYSFWQDEKRDAPEAVLYQIFWLDRNGYHDRAGALMNELYVDYDKLPHHCARELSRHQLRVAINDINSSKTTLALQNLRKILLREPNCLQAHFHTQLANLQSDNLEENRRASQSLIALYDGYKSKNKRGVIATSWWLLAQAETKAGNPLAAREARQKSKGQK